MHYNRHTTLNRTTERIGEYFLCNGFRVIVEIFQYWYAGNDHVFARIGICFVKYNLHSCILFHFVASFQVYARIIKARSMISIIKLFLYFINETHSVDTIHKYLHSVSISPMSLLKKIWLDSFEQHHQYDMSYWIILIKIWIKW